MNDSWEIKNAADLNEKIRENEAAFAEIFGEDLWGELLHAMQQGGHLKQQEPDEEPFPLADEPDADEPRASSLEAPEATETPMPEIQGMQEEETVQHEPFPLGEPDADAEVRQSPSLPDVQEQAKQQLDLPQADTDYPSEPIGEVVYVEPPLSSSYNPQDFSGTIDTEFPLGDPEPDSVRGTPVQQPSQPMRIAPKASPANQPKSGVRDPFPLEGEDDNFEPDPPAREFELRESERIDSELLDRLMEFHETHKQNQERIIEILSEAQRVERGLERRIGELEKNFIRYN